LPVRGAHPLAGSRSNALLGTAPDVAGEERYSALLNPNPRQVEKRSPPIISSTGRPPHLGRKFTEDTKDGSRKIKTVLAMRAKGFGYRKIAREVGLGVGTVMRLTAS
jgi:hypothetical protein